MRYLIKSILLLTIILYFTGCDKNIPSPNQRVKTVNKIIVFNNLKSQIQKSEEFEIFSISSSNINNQTVSIYIEGDGLSWLTRTRISKNPTPLNPLALKLMVKDTSTSKIYLARVCQYTNDIRCSNKYWTSHRFSKEVVNSYDEFFSILKIKNPRIKDFIVYGYSGGAAISLLLASKRNDIKKLVTIAGNIDTEFWTNYHNIAALYGSLNPVDFTKNLKGIKQVHLIGAKDKIINEKVFQSYLQKTIYKREITFHIFSDFTHSKGWIENWVQILEKIK